MSEQDIQLIRKALENRWLFWLYFWRIPRYLKTMADEMDRVWSIESKLTQERDESVRANKIVLNWVHVTHRLGTTPDAIRALFAAGKRLKLVLFLCLGLSANAAPAPSSTWVLYSFGNGQKYAPSSAVGIEGDIATFNFPKAKGNAKFPTFLTTTVDTNILGDLTGKTISATLEISVIGNPIFVYGGQGDWNNCPSPPANTRLYFSTNTTGFNLQESVQHENGHWWSHAGVVTISAATGLVTISDTLSVETWSNANGHSANENQAYTDAFNTAVANVRQIGVACSGACFFDVGVAIQNTSGTAATFHLISYSAD